MSRKNWWGPIFQRSLRGRGVCVGTCGCSSRFGVSAMTGAYFRNLPSLGSVDQSLMVQNQYEPDALERKRVNRPCSIVHSLARRACIFIYPTLPNRSLAPRWFWLFVVPDIDLTVLVLIDTVANLATFVELVLVDFAVAIQILFAITFSAIFEEDPGI